MGEPYFVGLPPRQAEVRDANPTVLIDEDICRLQIAMNDASLVCIMNRAGDVADDRCRIARHQWAAGQSLRQAFTLDVAHRKVMLTIAIPDLENGDDVG